MNIVMEKDKQFEIGDIVDIEDTLYFVVSEREGYILRTFNNKVGWFGFNGHYKSLDSLYNEVKQEAFILDVYSQNDYELKLVKKEVK